MGLERPAAAQAAVKTVRWTFGEALNPSSAAEGWIFSSSCVVPKLGNTFSIPPILEPSSEEKSLSLSTCRRIQSFPMPVGESLGFRTHSVGMWAETETREPQTIQASDPQGCCFFMGQITGQGPANAPPNNQTRPLQTQRGRIIVSKGEPPAIPNPV